MALVVAKYLPLTHDFKYMDVDDFARLKAEHGSVEQTSRIASIVNGFEQYARDGQPYSEELWTEDEFTDIVKLLGIDTVKADDILRYTVTNEVSGNVKAELHEERPLFEGEVPIGIVLPRVADRQNFWEDEPNEYRATVMVKLDDTTAVVLGQTCTEPDDDEYVFRHWVGVIPLADVDNYPGWGEWRLEFFDTAAYEKQREAREIEREKAEGALNLSRLTVGETVRVTTKRLESSSYGGLTNEESDERFVDTFKVVEAGSQPICEVRPGEPHIRLLGGGRWTTRRQNPVQRQDRAITPSYGFLYPNQHLMFKLVDETDFACSDTVIESVEII